MSLLDMQRVFSKILTNDRFRSDFIADPERVCSVYDLESSEIKSLVSLDMSVVAKYAMMLKESRVSLALEALPVTSLLLGHDVHAISERYAQECPPVPASSSPMFNEARMFQQYLLGLVDSGELKTKYVREVSTYEMTLFFLANDVSCSETAKAFTRDNAGAADADLDGEALKLKPLRGQHARLVTFRYNIVELMPMIANGESPDVPEQATHMLFYKIPHEVGVKTNRVNGPTKDLLELCDGTRSVESLLSELSGRYGVKTEAAKAKLEAGCLAALRQLVQTSVVTLRP